MHEQPLFQLVSERFTVEKSANKFILQDVCVWTQSAVLKGNGTEVVEVDGVPLPFKMITSL